MKKFFVLFQGFSPINKNEPIRLDSQYDDINIQYQTNFETITLKAMHELYEHEDQFIPIVRKHLKEGGYCRFLITDSENCKPLTYQIFSMTYDFLKEAIKTASIRSSMHLTESEVKKLAKIQPGNENSLYEFLVRFSIREMIDRKK